ncbi:hypothetical protein C4D60_Mb00t19920 [Musa balbisiana]|uniref:Uncharacterized protein n=1 Tax=Musa balbisiana TaxID=52838 RepID=A0A4S8I425_MUSBA|nr:hypothetical protein C4D60_Mb00t19920 [Musa balbisiana]
MKDSHLAKWDCLKEDSEQFKRKPPDKHVKHYSNSETSTQSKQRNIKEGVEEKTTGTKTGYQLSSSNNNSWKRLCH